MTAPPPRRRTGLPDVDALLDRADTEQAKLNDLMAVSSAESAVMDARAADLAAVQKAARRKISAAEDRVTRAQEDGGAGEITAAQVEYEAARRETRQIQAAGIREMLAILNHRKENFGAVQDQLGLTWDAAADVTRALNWPEPREQP